MKILLAVDGSSYTKKMLAYLSAHDELFGPSHDYTLLTVHPALPPRARAALGKAAVNSYYAEETEKVIAPSLKFLTRQDYKVKTGRQAFQCIQVKAAHGFCLLVACISQTDALAKSLIWLFIQAHLAHTGRVSKKGKDHESRCSGRRHHWH